MYLTQGYPLLFQPIFQERIWGGRRLETLYNKALPPHQVIGESWEISDRPDAVSVVRNGPLQGRDLNGLIRECPDALVGHGFHGDRFPLLIKILDAQQTLSLQVHPPASIAGEFGGEPKTEMWYIAHAEPGAVLYAGLKCGVGRNEFERRCRDGSVADCFHRIEVQSGDCMFLPSGRVHAIGEGLVIFEIQQNSDTTYRVFDWNRLGLDGKPRTLHLEASLASIDFGDFEPSLVETGSETEGALSWRELVIDPLFEVSVCCVKEAHDFELDLKERCCILAVLKGEVAVRDQEFPVELLPGEFSFIPAAMQSAYLDLSAGAEFLVIQPGTQR